MSDMIEPRLTFDCVFAIFTEGGGVNTFVSTDDKVYHEHEEGEFVVHADTNGQVWVLLFEDIEIADRVRYEYAQVTGDDSAEVKPTTFSSLEYDQNVRLYRWDGTWEDITRADYARRLANN